MRIRRTGVGWASGLAVACALPPIALAAGSGWSVERTPNPVGAKASGLFSISCASSRACTAVGAFGHGPLTERWNGARWELQQIPKLSDRDALSGVSCPSTSVCVAVGVTFSQPGGVALVERWDGGRWSIQPTPRSAVGTLSAVSCSSVRACVAVGYDFPHRTERPLVERWNGRTWSIQPTPDHGYASLSGVSCTSARDCTAVGSGSTGLSALVEHWNGLSWSVQDTPQIKKDALSLYAISCTAASSCTAVGQDELPPPCESTGCGEYIVTKSLAEHWDGHTWTIQHTRNPTSYSPLTDVSCTSASACTAVGGAPGSLAERWDGVSWTVQYVNPHVRGRSALLRSVTCVSSSTCLAVGESGNPGSGDGSRTLVERWRR